MLKTYTLYIKAYTPETIPMSRLALYMQSFAAMLGHESAIHFAHLAEGSTRLVTRVDYEHVPKVQAGLDELARGEGSPERIKAQDEIDNLLADDNATGFVYEDEQSSAEIITFPGVTKPKPTAYGPIKQEGTLDGFLIGVGGADRTIHIRLQNGDIKYAGLDTDREIARRLAKHMFEPVRVFGTGSWLRDQDANWTLKRFKIESFEVLQSNDLREVIEGMREIDGSEWTNMDDPITTLQAMRDDFSGLH